MNFDYGLSADKKHYYYYLEEKTLIKIYSDNLNFEIIKTGNNEKYLNEALILQLTKAYLQTHIYLEEKLASTENQHQSQPAERCCAIGTYLFTLNNNLINPTKAYCYNLKKDREVIINVATGNIETWKYNCKEKLWEPDEKTSSYEEQINAAQEALKNFVTQNYKTDRSMQGNYLTSFFGFNFGYSKGEKLGAIDALMEYLDGRSNYITTNDKDILRQGRRIGGTAYIIRKYKINLDEIPENINTSTMSSS